MTSTHHMAYDIDAAMKFTDEECVAFFERDDGTKPTPAEVRRAIMIAYSKGYAVVPTCDNVDERGVCKGHPVEEDA